MEDTTRQDIRRLLKTFGIQADETIMAHLERQSGVAALQLRVTLEDVTDYGDSPPEIPLRLEIESEIRAS